MITNSNRPTPKPQLRSMIVCRGWAVVDRLNRQVVSPIAPEYRHAKDVAQTLSAGEPPLVLADGSHCARYSVARVRLHFDFPRKYLHVTAQRQPQPAQE